MACMEVIMTATRDAREIAEMFLKEHSWGDTHNILSDKKILAKEHLALLEAYEIARNAIRQESENGPCRQT